MNEVDIPWSERPSPSIIRPGVAFALLILALVVAFFSLALNPYEPGADEGEYIYRPIFAAASRDLSYIAVVLLGGASMVAWGWRRRLRWWDWPLGGFVVLLGAGILAHIAYLLIWVRVPVFSLVMVRFMGYMD